MLAAAVNDGTLRVPRLFVLDSLVKFARRRAENLRDYNAELDVLLKALVARTEVPEPDAGDAAATVRDALDSVGQLGDAPPTAHTWPVFEEKAGDALRLTTAEREKPTCNDQGRVRKGSNQAVAVTVEFYTDRTPGDLRHFCNPYLWYRHSAYFLPMKRLRGRGAVNKTLPKINGWRSDLIETIVVPQVTKLVTPLRFTYSIENETNPSWVHLDYVLPEKTDDIGVDEGALDVRRVTCGPHEGRTRVSAKKAILFADPVLQAWPTIACDTFWTEMVIAVATGSTDDGGAPPIPIPESEPPRSETGE